LGAKVQITLQNPVSQQEAINLITQKINSLLTGSFPGVKIKNPQHNWRSNEMSFSFVAKKG